MNINELSRDMQEIIFKLAREHPITIEEAKECYLMGGDHADKLCQMRSAGFPNSFIKLQNQAMWNEKNKILWDELKNT
jgi:hypothetical protein